MKEKMQPKYKKASLTKHTKKYIKHGVLVKKLSIDLASGGQLNAMIVPNSFLIPVKIVGIQSPMYEDRISVSSFSDYVVRENRYETVLDSILKE